MLEQMSCRADRHVPKGRRHLTALADRRGVDMIVTGFNPPITIDSRNAEVVAHDLAEFGKAALSGGMP